MSDPAISSSARSASTLTGAPLSFWVLAVLSAGMAFSLGRAAFPSEQLILALVIAAAAAAFFRPQIALYGTLIAVPLIPYKQNFGPVPIEPVTVGIFLIVAACVFQTIVRKDDHQPADPHAVPLMLFIIASALSLFFASDAVGGIAVVMRYAGYALLAVFVSRMLKSEKDLEGIFLLMVIVAATSALMGLADYVYRPEQSIGLQGLSEEIQGRLAGTYENPNFFGEYLILVIPLGVALIMSKISLLRRSLVGFLTFVSLISLGLTYTRGSWLGLALGLVVFAYLTKRWLIWVFLAGSSLLLLVPGFLTRLISSFDLTQGTAAFRLKLWQIPLEMIRDHPLFGVGAGNYLNTFSDYVFKDPTLNVGWVIYGAHNTFLAIAAESGLIGLGAFLLIVASAARLSLLTAKRFRGTGSDLQYYNAAIAASLAGYLFNNLTSNSLLHPRSAAIFWFLLGLQVVVSRCATPEASAATGWVRTTWTNSYLGRALTKLSTSGSRSITAKISKPVSAYILNEVHNSRSSELTNTSSRPIDIISGSHAFTPIIFLKRGLSNMLSYGSVKDAYGSLNKLSYKFIAISMATTLILLSITGSA